jgi:hypothetical protein
MKADRAYYTLLPLLKRQSAFTAEKIKLCKTFMRPVSIYRAESWTRNNDTAKWLATFEEECLAELKQMKIGESNTIKN